MKSRYSGHCPACDGGYGVGAEIMKDTHGRGWVHKRCGLAQRATASILAGETFRGTPTEYRRKGKRQESGVSTWSKSEWTKRR